MSRHPADRSDLRKRVEIALATFLGVQRLRLAAIDPALTIIADALDGLVLGAGKRLRPAFGFWGYRGAGGDDHDEIVTALAALEFVQAGALIHDDIIDRSDNRRGDPSMHRRFEATHQAQTWRGDAVAFGASAAIIAGDLCLVWSDEMLHTAGVDAVALARARPIFDAMRSEVMLGQYLDVLASATGDTSVEGASKIARYKSAKYTVEQPLLIGAALADARPEITTAYSRYGLALGEAFQLRDDVLGVFGDPAETGKPAGDDLREGRRTYLIATAFEAADQSALRVLGDDLGDSGLDDRRIVRLREIIEATGALARTEARIANLAAAALDALASVRLDHGADDALTALAKASTDRRR